MLKAWKMLKIKISICTATFLKDSVLKAVRKPNATDKESHLIYKIPHDFTTKGKA